MDPLAIPPLSALVVLGAAGATIHLALLALARPRTAQPLALSLFVAANVLLVAAMAAALAPVGWPLATLAYSATVVGAAFGLRDWSAPARAFLAYLAAAGAWYVAYVIDLTLFGGLGPAAAAVSSLLLLFEVLAIVLTLVYAYEALETLSRVRWRRAVFTPPAALSAADAPLVSIHVPTYSEPPELVIETLEALARLDYPSFEVLVVDNNTTDPALWQPVERRCAELGTRFRFFHVSPLAGFKAGACNFALRHTDPRAEVIAVLDADYVVDPAFLRDTMPHFADPGLAFVQTPQDYREFAGNRYLTDCLHAYAYFFAVSMRARNEHNAAIFGGTMGLLRRSALEEIGGWDEWCITEDAEASLRLLQQGHRSLYVHRSYGHGLMPFDFDSYKKQRFRWAFGGVQILRKHWRSLVPFAPRPAHDRLTAAQRWWYLAAALLWFGEPLQLAFAGFLITGGLAYAFGIGTIARPLSEAILLFPLLFLGLGAVRFLWVLRVALGIGVRDAIGAAVSMFSLSWVVTQAVLAAVARPAGVFLRTSKVRSTSTFALALHSARWETGIAGACVAVAALVLLRPAPLSAAIAALCLWQVTVYGSAFVTSLAAVRSAQADTRPARYRRRREHLGGRVRELGLASGALASLGIFVALAGSALAPTVVDDFARAGADRPPLVPPAALATPAPPTVPPGSPAVATPGPVAPLMLTPQPFATAAAPPPAAAPGAMPPPATPPAAGSPPAAATLPPQAAPATPGRGPSVPPAPTRRPAPSPTARGLGTGASPPVDRRP